jgi:hypothetical protein
VLERLDRLTQDEARMTVAQTLGVVHGLMRNIKVVMEGAQFKVLYDFRRYLSEHFFGRLDGKVSTDNVREDLGMCLT